jgi:ankyrin repeat protein
VSVTPAYTLIQFILQYGSTALHYAARAGHVKVAAYLMNLGIDKDVNDAVSMLFTDLPFNPKLVLLS